MPLLTYPAQAAFAAFVAALLILMLRRPAERWNLLDRPGGRKRHSGHVPLTGGLAITLGTLAALTASFSAFGTYAGLFAGIILLTTVGLLDDLGEVSANFKMLFQIVAAVLMTSWGNNFLTQLGDLFGLGPVITRNWAIPLTVFATLALVNAINMFDGLDGLAGSLALLMLAFLTGFAFELGDPNASKILIVLAGAVGGFLFFNLPWSLRGRHRTFLGDSGSMILGYAIAWFSVELSQRTGESVPPPVMLWVVGLLLMDVFTVTVRRLARRRSPMAPDRDHIHHMLMRRGWSPRMTLTLLVGANAGLSLIGTGLWQLGVPDWWIFWSFLAVCVVYFAVFFMPLRYYRLRSRRDGVEETDLD